MTHWCVGGDTEDLCSGVQVSDATDVLTSHAAVEVDMTLGELNITLDLGGGGVVVCHLREMYLASPHFTDCIIILGFADEVDKSCGVFSFHLDVPCLSCHLRLKGEVVEIHCKLAGSTGDVFSKCKRG